MSGWSPLRTHLERTRRRPKEHKIGMQHIQINKRLQFETLAQSRGHSHASESLASLAWRITSGIADRARWRSGVVFVAFPCLFLLHIVTTASHSSECAQICGRSLGRWLAMVVSSHSRSFRSSSLNHAFVFARRSRAIRDTAPCDKDSHPVCCTSESSAVLTWRGSCRVGKCHSLGTHDARDRAWIAQSPFDVVFPTWRCLAPPEHR